MTGENVKMFELEIEAPRYAGYCDHVLKTPLTFRVANNGKAEAEVRLVAESAEGVIVRCEQRFALSAGERREIVFSDAFSPLYLSEGGGVRRASFSARLFCGGKEAAAARREIKTLPFDWWEGLGGDPARLAALVRPKSETCLRLLKTAYSNLKWGDGVEKYGYAMKKPQIYRLLIALFHAVLSQKPKRAPCDLRAPVSASYEGAGPVTEAGLGALFCSLLEAAGLHPVLALGEARVGVGVWLYDSGFLTRSTDDAESVRAYLAQKNLLLFDVGACFGGNARLAQAEKKFLRGFEEGAYSVYTDICGCRAAGIPSCPSREERGDKADRREGAPLAQDGPFAKWERSLSDLSTRNPLVSFTGKNALRTACGSAEELVGALRGGGMRLSAGGKTCGRGEAAREEELFELELSHSVLRVYAEEGEMREIAHKLMRAGAEAEEETGANVLYLALGILHYPAGGKTERAPVALLPVSLAREGVDKAYVLRARGIAPFPNSTLFDHLGQRFGVPLFPCGGAESLSELFYAVRAACGKAEGWSFSEEAYLAAFSFHRYLLWNDLRQNAGEFRKNQLIRALESGSAAFPAAEPATEPIVAPLPSDSSQDEAIALADAGASFVLHGPPGTGKSQTIANIIAVALKRGRRVLFVAEKKAALDVVKRRLEKIGLGDFCLELAADRAAALSIAQKIEQTLSLSAEPPAAPTPAEGLFAIAAELEAPIRALHEKGRLGVSAYGAASRALRCGNAPAPAGGKREMYAALTESALSSLRREIFFAAASAEECRSARGDPFENVELTGYSEALRSRVLCACETMLAECKHLRRYLSLLHAFYRQRAATLTAARLSALEELVRALAEGRYERYFTGIGEEELNAFCAAGEALGGALSLYLNRFRTLVEPADASALARFGREGGDWRLDRSLRVTAGRLSRAAFSPVREEETAKNLKTLSDICDAKARVEGSPFAGFFCDRAGGLVFAKWEEFFRGLKELDALGGAAFGEFDAPTFRAMCIRGGGNTAPALNGFLSAAASFRAARSAFLEATGGKRSQTEGEDQIAYFAEKASALIDNADLLRSWCRYRETAERLEGAGIGSVSAEIAAGRSAEEIAAGVEREAYRVFLEERAAQAPALVRFTAATLAERERAYREAAAEAMRREQAGIRAALVSRLQGIGESAERGELARYARGTVRGGSARALLSGIPRLFEAACPCVLASPTSVAQYLRPEAESFDLVVFDEASQTTAAEAAGAIARAKAAIVVGDPKQLPPTGFFRAGGGEEEESVLDEFLALGMPERKLRWHYRSRHESLIAFSNAAYYGNTLCAAPSAEAGDSRVKLIRVNGVYGRGGSKSNRAEAEALVGEIVRRLSNPAEKKSMGVVTFSVSQREEIEGMLARELSARGLEEAAYGGEEPLFVKNLENVQGDERDVILFSVCYGPDAAGRLSMNFGPLNRAGGWRRLNVAASRAREEMLVYASLTSDMLNAEKAGSRGARELKAFLGFAERGEPPRRREGQKGEDLPAHFARALARCGYVCDLNVGSSAFKVDVAVRDPRDKNRYALAVLFDGDENFTVKERYLLQPQVLAAAGWKVARVQSMSYYANPAREVERIKKLLDGASAGAPARMSRYEKPYRSVEPRGREAASYLFARENAAEIASVLAEIVSREQPISRAFLRKRCLAVLGVVRGGERVNRRLDVLIDGCSFLRDRVLGTEYFYRSPKAIGFARYRTERAPALRREAEDYTAYEVVAMIKGALEDRVTLYADEVDALFAKAFRAQRAEGDLAAFLFKCVKYGEEKGIFRRSASGRLSLA